MKFPSLEIPSWKVSFLIEKILTVMTSFVPPVETGCTHAEALARMDLSKSPGLPWTACGYGTKESVMHFYEQKMEQFFDVCTEHNVLWSLSNKDELRPIEKVESKSTRVFNVAPVEHTYICYRLYGRLCDAFYRWHTEFNAVGVSPYGGQWHQLMYPLDEHGEKCVFDTDGESYDLRTSRQFMEIAREVIGSFLPSRYLERHNWAFQQAINSYCVTMDGHVFQKTKSNPSGWLLTIIVNTIIMFALLLYAWFELYGWSDENFDLFRQACTPRIVGDDNICKVHQAYQHVYHPKNVVEVLSPIQPFETDGRFKNINEVVFCQAQTKRLPDGLLVPYYPSDKCYGSLQWLKKESMDPIEKLGKYVSLMEVYWFREDFRLVVRDEIRRHVVKYGAINCRDRSWQAYCSRAGLNLEHSYRKGNFKDLALLNHEEYSLGLSNV